MLAKQSDDIITGFLLRSGLGYVYLLDSIAEIIAAPHGLAVEPHGGLILTGVETGAGELEQQVERIGPAGLETVFLSSWSALCAETVNTVKRVSMRVKSLFISEQVVGFKYAVKLHLIGHKDGTGLAAVGPAYDTGGLELVHETAGAVVSDGELALYE